MYGKQHKKSTLLVTGSWLGSTNPALFPGSHTSERANLVSHYIWHVLGSGQWALTCDSVSAYTWVFSAFTTYYTSSWPHRARFERGISLYLALWHKIVLETGTRHKLFLQSLQIHGKNIISKTMREKLASTVLRFYPTGKEERVSVLDIKGQELLKTKGVRHHQVLVLFNIFPDDSHWSSIKTQCVPSISSSYILRWL